MAGRPLRRERVRVNAHVSAGAKQAERITTLLGGAAEATLVAYLDAVSTQSPTPVSTTALKEMAGAAGLLIDRLHLRTGQPTAASVTLDANQLTDQVVEALNDVIPDPEQRRRLVRVLEGGQEATVEPKTLPTDPAG